jgi:hypothetical protein
MFDVQNVPLTHCLRHATFVLFYFFNFTHYTAEGLCCEVRHHHSVETHNFILSHRSRVKKIALN